ncbi:MAG: hypothetical protein WAW02_14730 [Sideroxyarcus sp.]
MRDKVKQFVLFVLIITLYACSDGSPSKLDSGVVSIPSTKDLYVTGLRDKYGRIIEEQYPGFRIIKAEDFEEMRRNGVKDGISGSLVFGHFDSDKYLDFSAYLIGPKRQTNSSQNKLETVEWHDGMFVICHSNSKGDLYTCEKVGDWLLAAGFVDSNLVVVPAGDYSCIEGEGKNSDISTSFDSIGVYSEGGGGFYVRQPDGTYKDCTTSD